MDLVAFAAPAANALNLFAGIPALAALFGQPLPLMLAAAMALACVSAEAAAPEATESFPVVITGGPLTMSIPSMLTNLPQALANAWAKFTSYFSGPTTSTTAITTAASSTLLDALKQGNIHVALRGIGSSVATGATKIIKGIVALIIDIVEHVAKDVVDIYRGVTAAITGSSTATKGPKKAAGQVSSSAKRGLASAFGFGPKPEETLSLLQTATTFLRAFANKTGVWGEKAGFFGLYQLGLLFLFVCDHGHGSVMFIGHLMDLVGSGLQPFFAAGQEFLLEWGWSFAIIMGIVVVLSCIVFILNHIDVFVLVFWIYGTTVACLDYLRGLAGRIRHGLNHIPAFLTVFVVSTALMSAMVVFAPPYFLVVLPMERLAGLVAPGDCIRNSLNRIYRVLGFICLVLFSVMSLAALYVLFILPFLPVFLCQQLVGQTSAWLADLMATKEAKFVDARDVYDMSMYEKICAKVAEAWEPKFKMAAETGASSIAEVVSFLSTKNGFQMHDWLLMNAGNMQGLDMVDWIAVYLREAVEGKHGAHPLRVLTSRNSPVVIFKVLYEVLVCQATTVGPLRLLRAKNLLLDLFDLFDGLEGVYPGVAVLFRGLEVAHDMAQREEVTLEQWEVLYGCARELIVLYPEIDERHRFAPIFHWADLVSAQLVSVVNGRRVVAQSVAGKEVVEKVLMGCRKMVNGVGRLFV